MIWSEENVKVHEQKSKNLIFDKEEQNIRKNTIMSNYRDEKVTK